MIAIENFLDRKYVKHKRAIFNFFKDIKKANDDQIDLFHMFTNDTPTSQMHKVLLEFFPNKSFFESSKFFSLGAAGAGINFHYHGDTLFSLIHGSKTWYIYPPGRMPHTVSSKLDLIYSNWKNVSVSDEMLTLDQKPIICTQTKGTALYLPQLHYHSTENNGEAIGVGWQIDVQRELAINTAKDILRIKPNNTLAQHTLHWFNYETDPDKWINLYKLKPLDLTFAQETLKAICNNNNANQTQIENGKEIIQFWENKLDFIKGSKSNSKKVARISLRTFLLSFSQLIHQMFQFRFCLNIDVERIKRLIKLISILDVDRSMSISKIFYNTNKEVEMNDKKNDQRISYEIDKAGNTMLPVESQNDNLAKLIIESKREFLEYLKL